MEREKLAELLASLGDTADKVADTLTEAGVAGESGNAYKCPIACWLTKQGGGFVSVGPDRVWVALCDDGGVGTRSFDALLPLSVQSFIKAFDMSEDYQWLRPGHEATS